MHENSHPQQTSGYSPVETLLTLAALLIIAVAGYFIFHKSRPASASKAAGSASTATSTANPPSNPYAILSPATVPPKTPECNQALTFASNGSSGPVECAGGGLNVAEWNALAGLEPKVMTLGYGATAAQVQVTICTDTGTNLSAAIEANVYQISALYYGWNFAANPSAVLMNGAC